MKHYYPLYQVIIIALLLGNYSCGSDSSNKKTHSDAEHMQSNIEIAPLNPDSVLFSFVFMGCNRIDYKNVSTQNPSTANLVQLQRSFIEACAIKPKPTYFFFLGDLVLGLDKNPQVLESELKAWVNVYNDITFSPISKSGIQMVAVPGNHEMLYLRKTGKGKNEVKEELPASMATATWQKLMGAYIPKQKINRAEPNNGFNTLTYSFDYEDTHFIIVNTDTYNPEKSEEIGLAPTEWINADIQKARKNSKTKHVFLLGHKPCYADCVKEADDLIDSSVTNSIWPTMENNQVEAMLSAHSHMYFRTQPHANKSYQVIAGNAGSKYAKCLSNEEQFYGYSVIYVMKNKKVILQSMGRSIPVKDYMKPIKKTTLTTQRDFVDISWGTNAPAWPKQKAD